MSSTENNNFKQQQHEEDDPVLSSSSTYPWVSLLGVGTVHWTQGHMQYFTWYKCLEAGFAKLWLISNKKNASEKCDCYNLHTAVNFVVPK